MNYGSSYPRKSWPTERNGRIKQTFRKKQSWDKGGKYCWHQIWLYNLQGPELMKTWDLLFKKAKTSAAIKSQSVSRSVAQSCFTLWVRQAPLSVGFSRQEYWSGLPSPPPEDLSNSEIRPESLTYPALASGFFTTVPPQKPSCSTYWNIKLSPHLLQSLALPIKIVLISHEMLCLLENEDTCRASADPQRSTRDVYRLCSSMRLLSLSRHWSKMWSSQGKLIFP